MINVYIGAFGDSIIYASALTRAVVDVRGIISDRLQSEFDCDDYKSILAWGEAHLEQLWRYLPYDRGVLCGRWLCSLLNRISPALFDKGHHDRQLSLRAPKPHRAL